MPDMLPGLEAARPARPPRERRLDLDRAKGYAILLVVAGHLVANTAPEGAGWYEPLRYALYRFHMPFFLYLSGTVAVLSGVLAAPPALPPYSPDLIHHRAADRRAGSLRVSRVPASSSFHTP